MRVALVISSLECGGAQRALCLMTERWVARGDNITVITLSDESTDHFKLNGRVKRVSLNLEQSSRGMWDAIRNNIRRIGRLRTALRQTAPHLVVSFMDQVNVLTLLAGINLTIPVIVSERIDPRVAPLNRTWSMLRSLFYRRARAVVVQTEAVRPWAARLVSPRHVRVIPNFVRDLPEPPPFQNREPLILGIGRLDQQKGFDLLLRAFAMSRARAQGWRLIIVGEGAERRRLELLINEQGLQELVELPGLLAEPAQWLSRAQVFVLSSRFEGFPNALLEAMAMGCAVASTDCHSGPGEIICDSRNGLLVAVDDVNALTAALDCLTEHPLQTEKLAREAKKVRKRFALERVLKKWDELIASVLDERSYKREDLRRRDSAGWTFRLWR